MVDPRPLTRGELSRFLPDQRSIRAFEKLFDIVPSEIIALSERIITLEDLIPIVEVVADSHTTERNEIVICGNTETITVVLNAEPLPGETVVIVRRNGPVFVSGAINGGSGFKIRKRYDAPSLVYVNPEWSIV